MTFSNIVICIMLLVPVSHVGYCVYVLPILWFWGAQALRARTSNLSILAIFAVMVLWFLVLARPWPSDGDRHTIGALDYSVPFVANLIALTCSVVGQRFAFRTSASTRISVLAST